MSQIHLKTCCLTLLTLCYLAVFAPVAQARSGLIDLTQDTGQDLGGISQEIRAALLEFKRNRQDLRDKILDNRQKLRENRLKVRDGLRLVRERIQNQDSVLQRVREMMRDVRLKLRQIKELVFFNKKKIREQRAQNQNTLALVRRHQRETKAKMNEMKARQREQMRLFKDRLPR